MGSVIFTQQGHLGVITLNRPQRFNALNSEMIQNISQQLELWEHDPQIRQVLLKGVGERGLCAGGDITQIYDEITKGRPENAQNFFRTEYQLNRHISTYAKPYISLMDGVVLGGGVGISTYGSHRIVTERTRCGMPETGIGFFPDVGVTYLLARSPGCTGFHAALSGSMFDAANTVYLGLADAMVPVDALDEFTEALTRESADAVVERFAVTLPRPGLGQERAWIDQVYRAKTDQLPELMQKLSRVRPEMAQELQRKSPTALAKTLAAMNFAVDQDLGTVLARDLELAEWFLGSHDFPEGIRAQVIDKDRQPQWRPSWAESI